ncbi:hypothetical protein EMIHUDRAFT_203843 [Emiliania huxleyi CCMP1516]|uniref:Ankyrin repeat protein n=2 Tax=Emiliania huxleyi TaxID=2903 RepID=A0A0D3K0H7_EMIH1|nr:hypothetical protein EMIHUDRAFT_203843 [Emiliania huxleyi CCMP1516]EOD29262.1 hypothetical protein EMIHUDRAFT_203843 [Emiliania huxleyi CCMP1516]|eukprot:XP_005781691.1 hypothetical protein EMIHUDRAFT_203843 [Emiliania huxleyi CCMP1516]
MSELGLPAIATYAPDESAVLADLALADPASPATAPLDSDLRDSAERALEEGDIPALLKLLEEAGITGAALGGVLILALQHSSLPAVSALLERGANPEALHDEDTPLHSAAGLLGVQPQFALEALRQMLLTDTKRAGLDQVRDGEGRTVLATALGAARLGQADEAARQAFADALDAALELLLDRGSSLAAADDRGDNAGDTPLHIASEWASAPILRRALAHPTAARAMAAADGSGGRPLDRALAAGRSENSTLLLATLKAQRGGEALLPALATHALGRMAVASGSHSQRHAASADYGACVRMLLAARADLERKGAHRRAPLGAAAASGAPAALLSALLRAGARRDAVDKDGRCALMLAAAYGHSSSSPATARLMAHDAAGATALMLAAARPCAACVSALLEAGAAVAACDEDGRCALLYALLPGAPPVPAVAGKHHRRPSRAARRPEALSTNRAALEATEERATEPPVASSAENPTAEPASTYAVGSGEVGPPLTKAPTGLSSAAFLALACDVDGRCGLEVASGIAAAAAGDAKAYEEIERSFAAIGGVVRLGSLALSAACARDDAPAATHLLAAGATASGGGDVALPASLVSRANAARVPLGAPLAAAALAGSLQLVELLLSKGAPAGPSTSSRGKGSGASPSEEIPLAPLSAAAAAGSVTCARGAAPIHWAADSGDAETINALLSAGADPEMRDGAGRSALRRAAIAGQAGALPMLLPATRAALDAELDGALADGDLGAAALLADVSGTPSLLWRVIDQQGVDSELLTALIAATPRAAVKRHAVHQSDARRTVMHEAVDSGSHATACALCAALPEELLLQKSGDDLTPIGLAIATKGDRAIANRAELLAEALERATIARLGLVLELLHSADPKADERAAETAEAARTLAAVCVERWGGSRRSCVLAAAAQGAPLPSAREILTAMRCKMEGGT